MDKIDYTYEPPMTQEQKRLRAEMLAEGKKISEIINEHYNAHLATMIKMFCEKNKCDFSDIAIYHGIKGMEYRFWIDFKKKGE